MPLQDYGAGQRPDIFQFQAKLAGLLRPIALQGLQFCSAGITCLRQNPGLLLGPLLQKLQLEEHDLQAAIHLVDEAPGELAAGGVTVIADQLAETAVQDILRLGRRRTYEAGRSLRPLPVSGGRQSRLTNGHLGASRAMGDPWVRFFYHPLVAGHGRVLEISGRLGY